MSFDHENLMQAPVQSVQTSATEPRSRQVFYGWWVVLASAIGLFWGLPISVYSFTVFSQATDARVPRWPRSDFAGVHFAPFRGGYQRPVGRVAHRSLRFAPSARKHFKECRLRSSRTRKAGDWVRSPGHCVPLSLWPPGGVLCTKLDLNGGSYGCGQQQHE